MMPRYIDADWLLAEANMDGAYGYVGADQIAKAPSDKVVELVRCKDCEHYIYHDKRCGLLNHGVPNDFFCKLGERPKQISAEFAKLMREGEIQVRWKKNE